MSLIRFDSGAHWYTNAGEAKHDADLRVARKALLYPSVTTIDKDTFRNEFLEKWKLNQLVIAASENPRQPHENQQQYAQRIYDLSMEKARNAAQFGKEIHDACEHYPQLPMDQSLMPWFLKFEDWYKSFVSSDEYAEQTRLDHETGIAGRVDRCVISKAGARVIIDYKTQDVKVDDKGRKKPVFYDAWQRQLAQYAVADAKTTGEWPRVPDCISIIIDSNEGGLVYPMLWTTEDIEHAYEEFIRGAWLWFNKRGYWPVGKWYPGNRRTGGWRAVPVLDSKPEDEEF
jgi:hypothetical protein